MQGIKIGRLLRANNAGFVVGCRVSELDAPAYGGLVRVPIRDGSDIFGIIHDIHIDDDGIVRQLVTADSVDDAVIADNRVNRNVPVEISVLTVGYRQEGVVRHLLPPRPPLSLDVIYLCSDSELKEFVDGGRLGYFRHILRMKDLPVGEILVAHFSQVRSAYEADGSSVWEEKAIKELVVLLRDDYETLMSVLGALGDLAAGTA